MSVDPNPFKIFIWVQCYFLKLRAMLWFLTEQNELRTLNNFENRKLDRFQLKILLSDRWNRVGKRCSIYFGSLSDLHMYIMYIICTYIGREINFFV
jgi:hypothetical protein